MSIDTIWNKIIINIDEINEIIDGYSKISNFIMNLNFNNVLLYGTKTTPFEFLWEYPLLNKYKHHKNSCIWEKEVMYNETPLFFEIDAGVPNQTKNVYKVVEFIKTVVCHPCIHNDKHLIIIKNIEIFIKIDAQSIRVILEKYSLNARFICTTNHYGNIETPILSRFHCIRIKLPNIVEIEKICNIIEIDILPIVKKTKCQNIYKVVYIHWISKFVNAQILEKLLIYNNPIIPENLEKIKKTSITEQLRTLSQQLLISNESISRIAEDLIQLYPKKILNIIKIAAEIDHMSILSSGGRDMIFIEYLLNSVIVDD